ncbi:hypothetical protein BDA99DRAFT_508358 [Phascolomyces articulosus]|uniref:Kinetochore protein Sos7 coiled-coil domain-containing protein n=1 Tax=Phascolomyces articulosus TaxID=60185 RepID=A0AAD5K125_9FUNG|nr:hypothetical protein BDA99DRAFT_508358 [Phascolomyces articulosus]
MDTELKRDIREFKERELYLHSLQKEYNRQTGLSFSGSNTPVQSINLPLHPTTLQKELDDYKDYAGRLEEALIQRETKEKFLRFILQDPPHEISTDEYVSAEKKAIDLERQIRANQEKMNDLKNTIKQKTSRVETLHSRISTDVDQLTRIIDDIEKNTKLLEQVETQLDQQTGLSLDEAMKIEEQLTDEIIQVNMDIDERRDRISRMKKEATENQRIVDELETRWEGLKQEASSRQVYTEQHLQKLNEATHRYFFFTLSFYSLFLLSFSSSYVNYLLS